MATPQVTKRKGRKYYYAWVEDRYVSTGQTEQRAAIEVARRMQAVGVEAYRQGKQSLSDELEHLVEDHLKHLRDNDGRGREHLRKKRIHLMRPINERAFKYLRDVQKRRFQEWLETLDCGAKTRNEYMTSWNVFLDWLVFEDRLDENPIRGKIRRARASKDETGAHARRTVCARVSVRASKPALPDGGDDGRPVQRTEATALGRCPRSRRDAAYRAPTGDHEEPQGPDAVHHA